MQCSACAEMIPADSLFCPECGARQQGQNMAQSFAATGAGIAQHSHVAPVQPLHPPPQPMPSRTNMMPGGATNDVLQHLASGLRTTCILDTTARSHDGPTARTDVHAPTDLAASVDAHTQSGDRRLGRPSSEPAWSDTGVRPRYEPARRPGDRTADWHDACVEPDIESNR